MEERPLLKTLSGPVVRISPSLIHIFDARMLPLVHHKSANRSPVYNTGAFGEHKSILNTADAKEHAEKRKIIAAEVCRRQRHSCTFHDHLVSLLTEVPLAWACSTASRA